MRDRRKDRQPFRCFPEEVPARKQESPKRRRRESVRSKRSKPLSKQGRHAEVRAKKGRRRESNPRSHVFFRIDLRSSRQASCRQRPKTEAGREKESLSGC